jgi:hypothetical protein
VQRGRQFAALGAGRESDFSMSARIASALRRAPRASAVLRQGARPSDGQAMAFDDLGDCDSDIRGGVFSVKSEYRPNLEFEHAIRPAPAFLRSA